MRALVSGWEACRVRDGRLNDHSLPPAAVMDRTKVTKGYLLSWFLPDVVVSSSGGVRAAHPHPPNLHHLPAPTTHTAPTPTTPTCPHLPPPQASIPIDLFLLGETGNALRASKILKLMRLFRVTKVRRFRGDGRRTVSPPPPASSCSSSSSSSLTPDHPLVSSEPPLPLLL